MPKKSKQKPIQTNFKKFVSDYATGKVVNWALKTKADQSSHANFKWSTEDKSLLKRALLNPENAPTDLPLNDTKFKKFIQSVIENGLNSEDVRLFQKYKNKLPLRALGLAYDLSDFKITDQDLVSNIKIEAGYYMFEVIISTKNYSSRLPIHLTESSVKLTNATKFSMYFQSDKIAKRLIKLDKDAVLTLHNESKWELKEIKHFKLAKLTKNFFLSRLFKKLGKEFKFNRDSTIPDTEIEKLWIQYDLIFKQQLPDYKIDYHTAISQREEIEIPNLKDQMRNLILSLLKKSR